MSEYFETMGKMENGRDSIREQALDDLFPRGLDFPSECNHFDSSLIITDVEDNIIAWYLPKIISWDAHVRSSFLSESYQFYDRQQSEWLDSLGTLNAMIAEECKNDEILQQVSSH